MRPTTCSPRTLALGSLAALGAALPLTAAAAPAAQAAGLKEAKFWATYRVERAINWDEPRWQTFQDCWHTWWYEGDGFDHETQASTMPIKVLASGSGKQNGSVFFKFRTWDRFAESGRPMPGMADIARYERNAVDWTAGSCGVRGEIIGRDGELRTTPDPPLPTDCGSRDVATDASFDVVGSKLHLNTFLSPGQSATYRDCETTVPEGMTERGVPDAVTARFSARELFDPRVRVVRYRARETFREIRDRKSGAGKRHVTASVTWTLTLRRVGGGSARSRR